MSIYKYSKIYICVISLTGAFSILLTKPENMAVEAGNNVKMQCSSNMTVNSFQLIWYSKGNIAAICFCKGSQQPGYNCTFLTDSLCELTIYNVTANHAGEYECREAKPFENRVAYAQLIVLEGSPQCFTSPTDQVDIGGSVEMSCSVNYTGILAPVMTWFDPIGKQLSSFNQTVPGAVNYVTSVAAEIPSVLSHTCNTSFSYTPRPNMTYPPLVSYANNTPSYSFLCHTQEILVQYAPFKDNITINATTGSSYPLGTSVICSAEAEPEVFMYQWFDNVGEAIGKNYTLTLDQLGQDLRYSCTVCNLLGCNQLAITVNVVPVLVM